MNDRKYGRKTGGKFATGNPGKPNGARHKVTLAVEALFDGEAERLTRKAIDLALEGDTTALRLCLDRISPARKSRPVVLDLPTIQTAHDVLTALGAIVGAAAEGTLTPEEAAALAGLIEIKRRAIEIVEIEARLTALEAQV